MSDITKVELETNGFVLTDEELRLVSSILSQEFIKGLSAELPDESDVKMFNTFVRDVPNGTERGTFLVVELRRDVLIISRVELDCFYKANSKSCTSEVTQDIILGPGKQLFDLIAARLSNFVHQLDIQDERLPLVFIFGSPCLHKGLESAFLVRWTKGYGCVDVVGKDIAQLLKLAIERRNDLKVELVALVKDTTAVLMAGTLESRECRVGLVIGAGANACYMERLENVEFWEGHLREPRQVIIDTEWGGFGDSGSLDFIRTKYDRAVNDLSHHHGIQIFEKMTSGLYLGELVRRVAVECIHNGWMLDGNLSNKIKIPYNFKAKDVSDIESDSPFNLKLTRMVLSKMGYENPTNGDCDCIRLICSRVSMRSAHLLAAGLTSILKKMKRPHTTISISGSLFEYNHCFTYVMKEKLNDLCPSSYAFDFILCYRESSNEKGAALVAAVDRRLKLATKSASS